MSPTAPTESPTLETTANTANFHFALALGLSVLLHAGLLGGPRLFNLHPAPTKPPASPILQATLQPLPTSEALLKNTLSTSDKADIKPVVLERPINKSTTPAPRKQRNEEHAAQRKLAEHLYYPPTAIAQGLEGETRLLLTLAPDGTIIEAKIASSSGHDILDQAALQAARATLRLPNTGVRELLLPMIFRLE